MPCLFIVPTGAVEQPVVSGSVGECLSLVPDGKRLDLIEVALQGVLFHIKTDLFVQDSIPLAFTRSYFPLDDWSTKNRVFLPQVYDPFLTGSRFPFTFLDWMLPDRQSLHYKRISPGTSFEDAVYETSDLGPVFGQSRAAWNGWGWDLPLEDGTTYLSPEAYSATRPQQGSLVGIFDKHGNEVRLLRNSDGDLTEIQSPSGRWIRLHYEAGHLVQASDSSRNKVEYQYDAHNRLTNVKYPSGQSTTYAYDTSNRIVSAADSLAGTLLAVEYPADQGIISRVKVGASTYDFHYATDEPRNSAQVDISGPKGQVTRVRIHRTDRGVTYTVEKLAHVSNHR